MEGFGRCFLKAVQIQYGHGFRQIATTEYGEKEF